MSTTQAGVIRFVTVDIATAVQTVVAGSTAGYIINIVGFWLQMSGTSPTFKFNNSAGDQSGTFDVPGVYSVCGERDLPVIPSDLVSNLRITTTGTISLRGMIAYTLVSA